MAGSLLGELTHMLPKPTIEPIGALGKLSYLQRFLQLNVEATVFGTKFAPRKNLLATPLVYSLRNYILSTKY